MGELVQAKMYPIRIRLNAAVRQTSCARNESLPWAVLRVQILVSSAPNSLQPI